MKAKAYRVWLEDKNRNIYPVWKYIEAPLLKKWLKQNCWYNGEVYWMNDLECELANAPYDGMGYIVRFEEV